jgi:hypothetical protein
LLLNSCKDKQRLLLCIFSHQRGMYMRKALSCFCKIACVAPLIAFSNPLTAATVVVNHLVDVPVQFSPNSPFYFSVDRSAGPFSLSVGDTFIYNIKFKNNGSLTLRNIGIFSPGHNPPSSRPPGAPPIANTGITSTSVLSLLDQGGNVFLSSNVVNFTDPPLNPGYNSPGRSFGAVDFPSSALAGITRFYGLQVVGTVDAFSDPSVVSLDYDVLLLSIGVNDISGGGVPEPATWVMMFLGFGSIGASMRARRQSVKVGFSA